MSESQTYDNVWDAIEDTPDAAENMKLRSELMMAINAHIERHGWRQREAAARFGVTQPRISDLNRGRIDLFGLDALVTMATMAGLHIEMHITAGEPATTVV